MATFSSEVIVDDSQFELEGQWDLGGLTAEFNATVKLSHTEGSTATYRFNGE